MTEQSDDRSGMPRGHAIRDSMAASGKLEELAAAMDESIRKAGEFLARTVTQELILNRKRNCFGHRSVEVAHKAIWGIYPYGQMLIETGRRAPGSHPEIRGLLDCLEKHALRDNGDFYFPEEPWGHRDAQRAYRSFIFLKVAAWINHPLAQNTKIMERLLQYQHPATGAVFNFIGNDPGRPRHPRLAGTLNTSFFVHWALAIASMPATDGSSKERLVSAAAAACDSLCGWAGLNADNMRKGFIYTNWNAVSGKLITPRNRDYPGHYPGKVDLARSRQEFWQVGTVISCLSTFYAYLRRSGASHASARKYLDSAGQLVKFSAGFKEHFYNWPSMCKVAWGAGDYLKAVSEHGAGCGGEMIRAAEKTARLTAEITFLRQQLADGSWPQLNYPLTDEALDELARENRTCHPLVLDRQKEIIPLPDLELTGEITGEMAACRDGIRALLAARAPGSTRALAI